MDLTFSRDDQRAVFAEFLATMYFVFLGAGSAVTALNVSGQLDTPALVAISIAHGIGILTAVAWTANISGGHINPAVTLAMMATRNVSIPKGVAYIVAQMAGASAGALLLKWCIPNSFEVGLGHHALFGGMAEGEGLLMEVICTAFLLLVVFNTAVSTRGWSINAPIAIGLAIMLIHFVAVPWTGASVNPARSFGPALVANEWDNFWIYVIGPAIGALIMAGIWLFFKDYGEESLDPETIDQAA